MSDDDAVEPTIDEPIAALDSSDDEPATSLDPTEKAVDGARGDRTPQVLVDMLEDLRENPWRGDEIAEQIEKTFGEDTAIWVLDMSGFSRTVQERGIVLYLLMIHKMRRLALPVVEANRGVLVKMEADNLLCLFPTVQDALHTSHDVFQRLAAANEILPSYSQLYAAMGIGYGHILHITDEDVFGDEINLTHKLGEDLASSGEVLLTAAAHAQLNEIEAAVVSERKASISGLELVYYCATP